MSRAGIIPISTAQDTAGPMGRSVYDVAALLTVVAGSDAEDDMTISADLYKQDYTALLNKENLRGYKLGVLNFALGRIPEVDEIFYKAVEKLRDLGAEVVFIDDYELDPDLRPSEIKAMLTDFRININSYLSKTPDTVKVKSLEDLIELNKGSKRELALFGQDLFVAAMETSTTSIEDHRKLSRNIKKIAGPEGIDKLLEQYNLNALIAPSLAPAGRVDIIRGDHPSLGVSHLSAVSGYPHLTLPMGFVGPLPVGISFMGGAWSDGELLTMASVYEKYSQMRKPPKYLPSVEAEIEYQKLSEPYPNN